MKDGICHRPQSPAYRFSDSEDYYIYILRELQTTQNVSWSRASVRLSVCASVGPRPYAHTTACTDPDVTWGRGRGCPLVVHYWADLQSGHGLRCYGNIKERKGCAILVRTHNANFSYKLASIPRYHDSANGRLGGVYARCWPVTGE